MSTGRLSFDREKAQRSTTSEPSLPRRGRILEERSAALHSLLERDAATQAGIVVAPRGTVDRSHSSRHFDICENALAAICRAVLDLWNARLRDEPNSLSPLGAEFVALIEKELSENGRLVLKGNRINVTHYARALRATPDQ